MDISDITGSVQGTSLFTSYENETIKNIRLSNINLIKNPEDTRDKRASNVFKFEKINGLQLNNISVVWDTIAPEPQWESAFNISQVRQLEIEKISISNQKITEKDPSILFKNSQDASIRGITNMNGNQKSAAYNG